MPSIGGESVLHVDAAESLVDGPGLHIRHGRELHLPGDGIDEIGVNESFCGEVLELCDESIFTTILLCLCRNLLPLCAVVEARDRGVCEARCLQRYPQHT